MTSFGAQVSSCLLPWKQWPKQTVVFGGAAEGVAERMELARKEVAQERK